MTFLTITHRHDTIMMTVLGPILIQPHLLLKQQELPLQADTEKGNLATFKTLYKVPERLSLLTGTGCSFVNILSFKAALSVHVIAITTAG